MASIGINFRLTSNFVTDGAGETYCLAESYPTTRGGYTFGWVSATAFVQGRDRGITADQRLSGINFDGGNGAVFRLDLATSGAKKIRLAMGDEGGPQTYQYIQFRDSDNSTVLATIDDNTGTLQHGYDDATGTEYDQTNWPASNTLRSVTLSGTSIYFTLGTPAQPDFSTIAHFYIEDAASSAGLLGSPAQFGRDGVIPQFNAGRPARMGNP